VAGSVILYGANGKIKLMPLVEDSETLRSMFTHVHTLFKKFIDNMRPYNGLF
jgi:hypothetical protein